MNPQVGQGANQAFEDAGALGILLRNLPSKEMLQERLQMFEKHRVQRAGAIVLLSRAGLGRELETKEELEEWFDGNLPITNAREHHDFHNACVFSSCGVVM